MDGTHDDTVSTQRINQESRKSDISNQNQSNTEQKQLDDENEDVSTTKMLEVQIGNEKTTPHVTQTASHFIDLNDDVPTCRICHCTENGCDSVSGDNSYEQDSSNNNDPTNVPLSSSELRSSSSQIATSSALFSPIPGSNVAGATKGSPKKSCISINIPDSSSPHHQFDEQLNGKDHGGGKSLSSSKDTDYPTNKLISPCHCSGSLKWVHHHCLQQWLSATNSQRCELCKYQFSMTVKYKPIYKWRALNASPSDRRRLICNSVLNLILMICVFWSTYVLIERASSDARYGQIDWSFWTKMCVITIGFIGGVIFLFVQLRLYLSIFIRWRQSNRIIIIRNVDRDANANTNTNDKANNNKCNAVTA
ncbi:E3 ubiquitin-protein ligase MARCH8 [Fragariocoptes setiger]|uniref:E3 ubiquitin-protein ligase MARCH8 n=1 Tax=Fragariocoptes setiger TaxID=1670756 RepID=A0ABQ7SBJ7_9ACAR|nr:E3 ubiquitin-protein ligase MARCH8 [Fragariocoptes setiger]